MGRQLSAERTSVLIVGGEQALRRLIVETLAHDGGEVREAADALEALSMIAARQPDTLVLDLARPGLDGFVAIKRLLESPEARGLPVVVLTGRELSARERSFLAERDASLLEKRAYSGAQLRRLVRNAPFPSVTAALLAPYDISMGDAVADGFLRRRRPVAQPGLTPESPPTSKEKRPRAY